MKKNKLFVIALIIVLVGIIIGILALSHAHNNIAATNPVGTNTTTTSSQNATTSQSTSSTYPPIWGEYHVNLPNALILVDSQGRRTGEDPITGTVYREIPGTNYGEVGSPSTNGAGELFTSNLPSGEYTLYVLGDQTGSYWLDASHYDQSGQIFRGTIQKGSMIAYVQNYNTDDIGSSTFIASSTSSSTASITSAPPDNLPVGQ
jgi:hypothetical protein